MDTYRNIVKLMNNPHRHPTSQDHTPAQNKKTTDRLGEQITLSPEDLNLLINQQTKA
jgi:hypothetical protein